MPLLIRVAFHTFPCIYKWAGDRWAGMRGQPYFDAIHCHAELRHVSHDVSRVGPRSGRLTCSKIRRFAKLIRQTIKETHSEASWTRVVKGIAGRAEPAASTVAERPAGDGLTRHVLRPSDPQIVRLVRELRPVTLFLRWPAQTRFTEMELT